MKRINIIISLLTGCLVLASCGKWLDVLPMSDLPSEKVFKDKSGFYSALAGLYKGMSSYDSYGKAMTISQMEIAGQTFSMAQATMIEMYPNEGMFNCFVTYSLQRDVRLNTVESCIENMWLSAYNVIANANVLISNLEKDDAANYFETSEVKDLLLGEALAIRAYNHFDMLRIFQPPYLSEDGKTAKRMPYITGFSASFSPSQDAVFILSEIEKDLNRAAELMEKTDPLSTGKRYTDPELRVDRRYAMNYYAVKALQARVYLYMGQHKDAYDAAMEVIEAAPSLNIHFINDSEIALRDASNDYILRSCPMENIFGLLVDKIGIYAYLDRNTGFSFYERFRLQSTRFPQFYSAQSDVRTFLWAKGSGTNMYFFKYERPSVANELAKYPNPAVAMLRLGEMYLIAAEGAVEAVSVDEGVRILKILQGERKGGVTTAATKEELIKEILLEYRREMIGEGQVFYAYKRHNAPFIEKGYVATGSIDMDVTKYTPDIPAKEYDAGRRY